MVRRQPTEFGVQVKIALVQKNMSSKELARRIGKSRSTISEVISGKNKSKKTMQMIIRALDMEGHDE